VGTFCAHNTHQASHARDVGFFTRLCRQQVVPGGAGGHPKEGEKKGGLGLFAGNTRD